MRDEAESPICRVQISRSYSDVSIGRIQGIEVRDLHRFLGEDLGKFPDLWYTECRILRRSGRVSKERVEQNIPIFSSTHRTTH